ncbi:DUF2771 domain-containing protein [Corynebacterium tapiri]|uniref:DUF2771 domain-containing protein n=1 Tax=Corynebacterium tapiri TaxID=1448266 RepID=A0A5C4U667_9CORY|nr:DUF2771 domain-containing protein [Corynebacterium tapiri]TNM00386.1 DUF2771 domain-containing protein [Corynebacterium tapiri]
MATRKEAKRKSLLQLLTLLVVAAVIVAVVVLAQTWLKNRPDPLPQETALTVSWGDQKREVLPYLVAEPGAQAQDGQVDTIEVSDQDTVTIEVPDHVADHDWTAVMIYSDPAANDQVVHGPHEASSVEVAVTSERGSDAKLSVVEIQSVLIGKDEQGQEAPFTTVWSVATQHA